jgi:hypothetical protein
VIEALTILGSIASAGGVVALFKYLERREARLVEMRRIDAEEEAREDSRIDDTAKFLLNKTQEQLDKERAILDAMRRQISELADRVFASEASQRQTEHDLRVAVRKIEEQASVIDRQRDKIAQLEVQIAQMRLLQQYDDEVPSVPPRKIDMAE